MCRRENGASTTLSVQEVRKKIEELHTLRLQRRKWLAITSLGALAITIVCLLIIRNAAAGLLQDGATYDEFVSDLTHEITRIVLPQPDGPGIQASYGTLPLPAAALPIDQNCAPLASEPSSKVVQEKADADLCNPTDDPQQPLGRFREEMVSEYQKTVTKIVNDLATIRGETGNKGEHGGFSADAVATLFISHIQDGLSEPSRGDYSAPTEQNSSEDSR